MDSDVQSNNKYPKSVNGIQCIGPCYVAGSTMIHPITLEEIILPYDNFCPVDTNIITDKKTGEKIIDTFDFCNTPTVTQKNKKILDKELRIKILAPTFTFNSTYFLKIYYNIGSLEEGIEWLEHNSADPYKTKERVFNQIMLLYSDNMTIADHRIINFIRDIMLHNISIISKELSQYIDIREDKIVLTRPDTRQIIENGDSKQNLIRSYIKTKFLGDSEISKFFSKFIRYGSEYLKKAQLSNILVESMIDYIVKRIESSF
jgi:hypothetical protein